MYQIDSESLTTFITDSNVELPRFQRKLSWNDRKNFDLCLSVFKDYPMGMVVMKVESEDGREIRYLLDGRQRRNAFTGMKNPETIYEWARRALRFKKGNDEAEIAQLFWDYVEGFFGIDESDLTLPSDGDTPLSAEDLALDDDESSDSDSGPTAPSTAPREDLTALSGLLEVILMVHKKKPTSSQFTTPFDLKGLGKTMYKYTDSKTGKEHISADKLVAWLDLARRMDPVSDDMSADKVLSWFKQTMDVSDEGKLLDEITKNWSRIHRAIRAQQILSERMNKARIVYLTLTRSMPNDDKKIFNLINSSGEPLSFPEILSSKPKWNVEVANPPASLVADKRALYERMIGKDQPGVVRWDSAATLLDRTSMPLVFPDFIGYEDDPKRFERKVTLSFRIFSGYHSGKLQKNDVSELAENETLAIDWSGQDDAQALNGVHEQLMTDQFFKYVESWGVPMMSMLSDALAMNFILQMVGDWKRKGRPTNPTAVAHKNFLRNGRILFDRSIYEYVVGQWKGSSDSKIAYNLKNLESQPEIFPRVDDARWEALAKELVERGTVNDQSYLGERKFGPAMALGIFMMAIQKRKCPAADRGTVDVDHLIPQAAFKQVASSDPDRPYVNHICNLAPLPGSLNKSKKDRKLSQLSDFEQDSLSELIGVSRDKFGAFQNAADIHDLVAARKGHVLQVLTHKRKEAITG